MTADYETYLSPFTWRYGSQEIRRIWSETNKRRLWRKIWVALAAVEAEYGLVTSSQLADLQAHQDEVDLDQALEVEKEIQHDLMAELKIFARQCPVGGRIIHLGATSMDIEDNADTLRIRDSLDLILARVKSLLAAFANQIERWADTPIIAFTHLQPAEPSTLGYRLAFSGQDLLKDFSLLKQLRVELRGKGFKGAVGTSATFADLIPPGHLDDFEDRLGQILELAFFPVTHQTYPRKQEFWIVSALAGVGATLSKYAFDLRILQSPPIGEWSEPFGKEQIGSSAMPFKRNPMRAEKIDSLARSLAQMPRTAWDNAANSLLERTLDDSANRRTILPETFLIVDELLTTSQILVEGLKVDSKALERNLTNYGSFAATEKIMVAAVKAGADRQEMHAHLRDLSLQAWDAMRSGKENSLADLLINDPVLRQYLDADTIHKLLDPAGHVGLAGPRARKLAAEIRKTLE
ncbi:MAG TPA: adenylosuccinate lyase [Anaerolineaceae bacterium]|nr:adenylosuccinate lyase [Anaerolineaceae bacterium]